MQLHSDRRSSRRRTWAVPIGVLGIAACVSLSSPRGGTGNVPVVRGAYKSGATQLVRIALETSAKGGTISSTGRWGLVKGDVAEQLNAMAELPLTFDSGRIGDFQAGPTFEIFAETEVGTLLIWNGKKYRGALAITRTDSGFLVVNSLPRLRDIACIVLDCPPTRAAVPPPRGTTASPSPS